MKFKFPHCLGILTNLILICICVQFFVKIIDQVDSMLNDQNKSILYDIQRDIVNPPLSNIMISMLPSCPQGTWSGIQEGCSCPNKSVELGTCTQQAITNLKCTKVPAMPPVQFNKWENEYTMCGLPAYDLIYLGAGQNCPKDYIKCSPSTCVKSQCPLLEYGFAEAKEEIDQAYKIIQDSKQDIKYTDGTLIKTFGRFGDNQNLEENFIKYLRFDTKEEPCINPNSHQKRDVKVQFPLSGLETGCDKYGVDNQNYVPIGYSFTSDLLQANKPVESIPKPLIQYLNDYGVQDTLLQRNALPLYNNPFCRQYKIYDEQINLENSMQKMKQYITYLSEVFLALFGINLIMLLYLFKSLSKSKQWQIQIIVSSFQIIGCVMWIGYYISIQDQVKENKMYINNLSVQCIKDKNYNKILVEIGQQWQNSLQFYEQNINLMLYTCIGVFIIQLIILIVVLMQRKKKIYANEHEHIDFDGFSKEIFVDDEITHDLSY